MLRRITTCALSALLIVSMTACTHTPKEETVIRPPKPAETTHNNGMSSGEEDNAQSADLQMSGRYRVSADGKLLRPDDAPIPPKPAYPDEAHFETPEGAEAFIHYVVSELAYMFVAEDTTGFEKISTPDCEWCQGHIDAVKTRQKNGAWIERATVDVTSMQVPFHIEGHEHMWNSDITLVIKDVVGYDGSHEITQPPVETPLRIQLRFNDGKWRIWAVGDQE